MRSGRGWAVLFGSVFAAVLALASGCGTSSDAEPGGPSTPAAVTAGLAALKSEGWTASPTRGMPSTYTGERQVAYFELQAPDGSAIDLQFLGSDTAAAAEAVAAQEHGYQAVAVGSAIAFTHPDGKETISPALLGTLRTALSG